MMVPRSKASNTCLRPILRWRIRCSACGEKSKRRLLWAASLSHCLASRSVGLNGLMFFIGIHCMGRQEGFQGLFCHHTQTGLHWHKLNIGLLQYPRFDFDVPQVQQVEFQLDVVGEQCFSGQEKQTRKNPASFVGRRGFELLRPRWAEGLRGLGRLIGGRGRNAGRPTPPAQIPASGITARLLPRVITRTSRSGTRIRGSLPRRSRSAP